MLARSPGPNPPNHAAPITAPSQRRNDPSSESSLRSGSRISSAATTNAHAAKYPDTFPREELMEGMIREDAVKIPAGRGDGGGVDRWRSDGELVRAMQGPV